MKTTFIIHIKILFTETNNLFWETYEQNVYLFYTRCPASRWSYFWYMRLFIFVPEFRPFARNFDDVVHV